MKYDIFYSERKDKKQFNTIKLDNRDKYFSFSSGDDIKNWNNCHD